MINGVALRKPPGKAELLSLGLAHLAYRDGRVRVATAGIAANTHLVASRQGLFAVNERSYSLLVHGMFFGITIRGPFIYVFESCDLPRVSSSRGRVIRMMRDGGAIVTAEVIATGLDNGCHQMDFIDDRLCILDTYNQRVLRFSADEKQIEALHPLPATAGRGSGGYGHVNSLLQVEDRILLLLHNGAASSDPPSVIAVLDKEWRELDRWTLRGHGCHNLVVLEDSTLLSCSSVAGELITLAGLRIPVSPMMTRGLSVSARSIVVGASTFSSRRERHQVPGTVTFLDRAYAVCAVLDIPGAPTDIRRLDGCDYSLSDYAQGKVTLPGASRTPATAQSDPAAS